MLKSFSKKFDESGQMLLVVLIIVLLLMVIIIAIVVNIRVDIKETQQEREYEKGYTIAEDRILKIASAGFLEAQDEHCYDKLDYSGSFCPTDCGGGSWECIQNCCKDSLPSDCTCEPGTCTVEKRCMRSEIFGMVIEKDETLEVNLGDQNSNLLTDINITWSTADSISLMFVYTEGGEYKSQRIAVCQGDAGCHDGFKAHNSVFAPLNLAGSHDVDGDGQADLVIPSGANVHMKSMRIRAIGDRATDLRVTGNGLPNQMEEIRVQGFTEGVDAAEGLSAPEVTTVKMIEKRLPSLFDYVLFVSNGSVSK